MQLTLLTGLLVFLFGLVTAAVAAPGTTLLVLVVGVPVLALAAALAAARRGTQAVLGVVAVAGVVLVLGWGALSLIVYPSIALRVLAAVAVGLFVVGMVWRIVGWARTPQPYHVPTTPQPETKGGAVLGLLADFFLFRSLWRGQHLPGSRGWFMHLLFAACSWLFHLAFWLVILRHLRYFFYPVPGFVEWFRNIGIWAGYVLAVAGLGLLVRRLVNAREAYVSILSDYFALGLVLVIAATGLLIHYHARMDLVQLKNFMLNALSFRMEYALNDSGEVVRGARTAFNGWMIVHLASVLVLVAYFPYSKLMHGIGLLFNPTRYQANNVRMRRHVNPWNENVQV